MMKRLATKMNLIVILVLLINSLNVLHSQDYKFRNLGFQEGICDGYVYTINQDKNGFIWLGTGEGLCKYDGFSFSALSSEDNTIKELAGSCFQDSQGNLWFGYNDGKIDFYNGKIHQMIITRETVTSKITDFGQADQQYVIAATQNSGLIIIKSKDLNVNQLIEPFNGIYISSMAVNDKGLLLLGKTDGLAIYQFNNKYSSVDLLKQVQELQDINIQKIYKVKSDKNDNLYYIGTEDQGLYKLTITSDKGNYTCEKFSNSKDLESLNVQSILVDNKSNTWISTFGNGLFKVQPNNDIVHFNTQNGLKNDYITSTFQDLEGNIWVATYGDGLEFMLDEAFTFLPGEDASCVIDYNGYILVGSTGKMVKQNSDNGSILRTYNSSNGLPADRLTSFYIDDNNILWIGSSKSGIYQMNLGNESIRKYYFSDDLLSNSINYITGSGKSIWIATRNGVYIIDKSTGLSKHYTTAEGLPYNNINSIFLEDEKTAWIATRSKGICQIKSGEVVSDFFKPNGSVVEFRNVIKDEQNNYWASTYGLGVFLFMPDTFYQFTTNSGLKSNYCYGLSVDKKGRVWVGHRQGFSCINISNNSIKVFSTEKGFNGDCSNNGIYKNSKGIVYFSTSDAIIKYNSDKDNPNPVAPMLNITSIFINDQPVNVNNTISLPYGIYKIRIDYIGLNFKSAPDVTYQYMLKGSGFDDKWEDITNSKEVLFNNVRDGNYQFILRAYNSDKVVTENPLILNIDVHPPFWKTWWFMVLTIAILISTVYFIIKFRERRQKELQEYLQRSLDERTREVVEQKEEIEMKNRDITDSINYAQRIQASILPPIAKLQSTFTGSFVFYQPRDIVSGDFYWFDKIDDNKFIIVCADSTGHGVPGAFMSMIGTTLIKDICLKADVNSPSEILRRLDTELRNTLNQNIEVERSNDGMDIIVCEININTRFVRYASAMRPMIIYRDGEEMYVKGSRSSVGGHLTREEKDFDDDGIQLSKGDLIYMFSDGYPDQFGGPLGKKFKMVRLKNLIHDIHEKPMEEQYEYVRNNFNLWKEGLDQVDDVLFMGIKI